MRTCLVSFRTHLITFTAAIALIASAAASAASVGSTSGGGGASSGASSGSSGAGSGGSAGGAGSGGGGGSGHGGGGGGGAHFGGGGGAGGGHSYGGGGYGSLGGYGSDIGHGVYAARGGYGVVGYESAGVARAGATPRAEHGARDTLALGPPKGSAAAATRVMDRFQPHSERAHHPLHRPGHHPVEVADRCGQNAASCANEMPAPLCILESNPVERASPDDYYWQYGCTTAVKVRVKLNAEPTAPID